ncbi:MAG: response regulator [Candidatus Heimdallarchaeota archaeon]
MSTNGFNKNQLKILIIDDDKDIRDIFEEVLKRSGYANIDSVGSGEDALTKLSSTFYNITLIDLNLPDIQGMDLISKARTISPDSEFIIVTGFGSLDSAIKSLQFDVAGYLEKPINSDKLLRTIDQVVDKHSLKMSNRQFTKDLEVANNEILFLHDLLVNNVNELNQSMLMTMVQIERLNPTPEQEKVLKLFQQEIRKNARLTGNIRRLEQSLQITNSSLESIDLSRVINNAVNRLTSDYKDKNFEIKCDLNQEYFVVADNNMNHLLSELFLLPILNDPKPKIRINLSLDKVVKDEKNYLKMNVQGFLTKLVYQQKEIRSPSELKNATNDQTFHGMGPFIINRIIAAYNGFVALPDGAKEAKDNINIFFLEPNE